jgi:hypothetical protein
MTDIHYYPVVDCDPNGTEKIALYMCTDENTVSANHVLWLEEIVPYHFRLKVRSRTSSRINGKYKIRCPFCNKYLRPITKRANETRLELYVCSSCTDTKKGGRHNANKRVL